jgi:hypothetical protein
MTDDDTAIMSAPPPMSYAEAVDTLLRAGLLAPETARRSRPVAVGARHRHRKAMAAKLERVSAEIIAFRRRA